MTEYKNELGQPIGHPLPDWQACERPPQTPITGNYCRIETLDVEKHAEDLYQAYGNDQNHGNWTYMPYGPFENFADFKHWMTETCCKPDPHFHSVIDLKTEKAVGVASLMRIVPALGVIEVGHIHFSPLMQRTAISTEALYLLMRRVFDELGYRRYEWKCDSLNGPSNKAAIRLGFTQEGIFRQLTMYKGRSRDTAWYSIIDSEWPALKAMFEAWLAPDNFDASGQQIKSLQSFKK